MDMPSGEFVLAGGLEKQKEKARLVRHGGHRPILVIFDEKPGCRVRVIGQC